MNQQINLYKAKTHLTRHIDAAANGETVIIAKNGSPMAQRGPISGTPRRQPRKLGQLAGRGIDWDQWWRDWKAADKVIEKDFEDSINAPLSPKKRGATGKGRRRAK
jgi:antitoxin (DNA-binding transcriptional repressor) of toxin-antitoxin stability system